MSARRRRRRNRSSGGNANDGGNQTKQGGNQAGNQDKQGGGRSRQSRRRRSRSSGGRQAGARDSRDRSRQKPKDAGLIFWGDPEKLPEPRPDVRITEDPAAVPRSLGTPPLPGQEKVAEHYFAAVYDRAVGVAGALAAAGGLIDPDALAGDE